MLHSQQSPVDITGYTDGDAPALVFKYEGAAAHISNTGEFVKVKYRDGNCILLNGREYRLIEAHTHNPSEHTVDGERFALEAHLVHTARNGDIAVVGVVFRIGEANAAVEWLIRTAPAQGEDDRELPLPITPLDFLSTEDCYYANDYYGYKGSLTTPPYTEGVRWLVLSEISEVSKEQVGRLAALTGGGTNNRAIQPLNGRRITAFRMR